MVDWTKEHNQRIFKLTEHFVSDERFVDLVEYLKLRDKGLRKRAFEALDVFILKANGREWRHRTEILDKIYGVAYQDPASNILLTNPLSERFLQPILELWLKREPENQKAMFWDGIYNWNSEALQRLLLLSPGHVAARKSLLDRDIIGFFEHAFHHIDESQILESIETLESHFSMGDALMAGVKEPEEFQGLKEELDFWKIVFEDWKAFSASGHSSFPEWCPDYETKYRWVPKKFYY